MLLPASHSDQLRFLQNNVSDVGSDQLECLYKMRVLTVPSLDHQTAFSPADQPVKKIVKGQRHQNIKNCRTQTHCQRQQS
jgi:hypothetical protein